jgi:hypothetical protein
VVVTVSCTNAPALDVGITGYVPRAVNGTTLTVSKLSEDDLAMQFEGPTSLASVFRAVYGDVPAEGAAANGVGLSILVIRTPAARWPAFMPVYRARVLERPRSPGSEMETEIIEIDGTRALVGELTDQASGLSGAVGVVGFGTLVYFVQSTSRDQVLAALDRILALHSPET